MEHGTILYYLTLIPALLSAITVHEFAHAWTAMRLGDMTAYSQGRVSLNPLRHLDPMGTLGIILVGFGWGRPVPVDTRNLVHPRANLLVSGAGPVANLVLAWLASLPLHVSAVREGLVTLEVLRGALIFFPTLVYINVMLACFNLLPLGPLDGAHVLEHAMPTQAGIRFHRFNQRYGTFALLGLILIGFVSPISPLALLIGPPIHALTSFFLG